MGGADGADDATEVELRGEREAVVTRVFAAPPAAVFRAWTTPGLLRRRWAPRSMGVAFVSCKADVRTGGAHRFVMPHSAAAEPAAFHGRDLEAEPPSRSVWAYEEAGADGPVTTMAFAAHGGGATRLAPDALHSREAALAGGVVADFAEAYGQLDALPAEPS